VDVKEQFTAINFQNKTLARIEQANSIIAEHQAQGFTMNLRQLYYQLVSRNLLENTRLAYQGLSGLMRDARDTGMTDWDAIEDRSRELITHNSWHDPQEAIRDTADWYQEDLWIGQRYRPEVWIEKEALVGVIAPICREYRVPYYACTGNDSTSALYRSGRRFAKISELGIKPLVLHLGDHDPNGLDMTRDITERLRLYARQPIEVRRLGLNIDQVKQHRLPPNFAKESDTRFAAYVKKFGTTKCWELDALSPAVIVGLIRKELVKLIDAKMWQRRINAERRNKAKLRKLELST
jgi:hypothetical protein